MNRNGVGEYDEGDFNMLEHGAESIGNPGSQQDYDEDERMFAGLEQAEASSLAEGKKHKKEKQTGGRGQLPH